MKKLTIPIAFFCLALGMFYLSGCAQKTALPPAPETSSQLEDEAAEVLMKLKEAREENAEETWEYQEAAKLFELANDLIEEGKIEEAKELLAEAKVKATQAIGAVQDHAYMEDFDETTQEIRKSILRDSFSKENLMKLPVSDAFFEFDSYKISEKASGIIDRNVDILKKHQDKIKFVIVFGFCDLRGTEEYNLALGKKRANEVKKYMIGKGMSPEIVNSISKGETDLWRKGESEESYALNRRTHFVVLSNEASPAEEKSEQ